MWVVFNKDGSIAKKLNNGSAGRTGVVGDTFSINAYFKNLSELDFSNLTAMLTIRNPAGVVYTPMYMEKSSAEGELFIADENDGNTDPLVSGERYRVFKWSPAQEEIFAYDGTYNVSIKVYDINNRILVNGRLDFYVEDGVYNGDVEVDISLCNQLIEALNAKQDTYAKFNVRSYVSQDEADADLTNLAPGQTVVIHSDSGWTIYKVETNSDNQKQFVKKVFDIANNGDLSLGANKIKLGGGVSSAPNPAEIFQSQGAPGYLTLKPGGLPNDGFIVLDEPNKVQSTTLVPKSPHGIASNYDLGADTTKWRDLYLSGSLKDGTNSISIAEIASKSDIPTKTSSLINDSNFAYTNIDNNFSSDQTINGNLKVGAAVGTLKLGGASLNLTGASGVGTIKGYQGLTISTTYQGTGANININPTGIAEYNGKEIATVEDIPSVSVSSTGTSTNEVKYITINDTEYKIGGDLEWGSITGTLSNQTDLKNELQNIREVAEGKTRAFVISYEQPEPEESEFDGPLAKYYRASDDTPIETWEDFRDYTHINEAGYSFKNSMFNSTSNNFTLEKGYLISIVHEGIGIFSTLKKYLVISNEDMIGAIYPLRNPIIRTGDIFYVKETNVPDRWVNVPNEKFTYPECYVLESKADLSGYVDTTTNYQEIPSIKYFTAGDVQVKGTNPHFTVYEDGVGLARYGHSNISVSDTKTFNFPNKQNGTYTFAMLDDIDKVLLGEKYVIDKTNGNAEFTGTLRGGNIIATTGNIETSQGMLGGVRVDTRNIDGCGAFHFYDYDAEACLDSYNYDKDPENYKHGLYFIGNFTGKALGINNEEEDCWSLIQYTDFTDLSYVDLEDAHLRPYQIAIKAETGEQYERFGEIIAFSDRTTGSWGDWKKKANSKLLNNTIAGEGSFSSGTSSQANGQYSSALGGWNLANGFCATALGQETWALNARELVCGVMNDTSDNSTLFTVGNGTPGVNRSNAFTVHTDGHAEVQTMGSTNNSVATKKYVDDNSGGGTQLYKIKYYNDEENFYISYVSNDNTTLSGTPTVSDVLNKVLSLYISEDKYCSKPFIKYGNTYYETFINDGQFRVANDEGFVGIINISLNDVSIKPI